MWLIFYEKVFFYSTKTHPTLSEMELRLNIGIKDISLKKNKNIENNILNVYCFMEKFSKFERILKKKKKEKTEKSNVMINSSKNILEKDQINDNKMQKNCYKIGLIKRSFTTKFKTDIKDSSTSFLFDDCSKQGSPVKLLNINESKFQDSKSKIALQDVSIHLSKSSDSNDQSEEEKDNVLIKLNQTKKANSKVKKISSMNSI